MKIADPASYLAVRMTLERYHTAMDEKDWPSVGECFATDSVNFYNNETEPRVGGQAVLEFIEGAIGKLDGTIHVMGALRVDMDGDVAHAWSSAVVTLPHRDRGILTTRGVSYRDELKLIGGSWKITRRVHQPLWQAETAALPTGLPGS